MHKCLIFNPEGAPLTDNRDVLAVFVHFRHVRCLQAVAVGRMTSFVRRTATRIYVTID